jgi:hypothetical protein
MTATINADANVAMMLFIPFSTRAKYKIHPNIPTKPHCNNEFFGTLKMTPKAAEAMKLVISCAIIILPPLKS